MKHLCMFVCTIVAGKSITSKQQQLLYNGNKKTVVEYVQVLVTFANETFANEIAKNVAANAPANVFGLFRII